VTFVRVRLPNGYEASLPEGATEGAVVLEGVPATNLRGKPLPATRKNGRPVMRRTSVKEAAAKKAAAKKPTGGDAEGGTQ
jgi:hypothetical protein